ncbi:hypothetical protein, variant 2 [Puccinia triticina 1-1 BBBD Race 1]|uniref:Uncharacterized protein n=1 Tax=Puccinia triticina (isolate 1-1 / race 1 (BBBD)) TaxID=630390 RepID=A0A180GGT9_PUCT1|nr:hypothetical protein, variant 2 [Puccinia triticina 1-1 BBBD Race 1]
MLCKTPKSTSWNLSDSPDLTGRVAIVTGGSTGTGYFISLELARKGAKVYLVCRNEERAQRAIISLRKELPDGSFDYIHFDLTRLRTCKDAASTFLKRENRLDILINNAAVSRCSSYSLSEDGIEIQACNTVGHFCLTERLVPLMKRTAQVADGRHARIVNITSASHKLNSEPDFASSQGLNQRRCSALERHGNSMLSIIVFNRELQRRLQGTGIICLAVHPGFISDQVLQSGQQETTRVDHAAYSPQRSQFPYRGGERCSLHTTVRCYCFGSGETGIGRVLLGTSRETSHTPSQCKRSDWNSRPKALGHMP